LVTLEGLPFNSSMISFHIWLFEYLHCKRMFTCWVSLFCNGFTFCPIAQATLVHIKQKMCICDFWLLYET
jgi:hypothetical protein